MSRHRIVTGHPKADAGIAAELAQYGSATVHEAMGRIGYAGHRIRPIQQGAQISGTAVTVSCAPGDNLMIHAAMSLARPGDVLVIDGKGDLSSALMGTIMMNACRKLGIAGVVMDGAARDTAEIIEMDYPVFAAGANPNGPTKNVPGRIGHPVSVGGVTVNPGDFIIGDADGVVVVEREKIEGLLPAAEKKVRDEAARIAAIQAGDTEAKWLAAALRAAGVLKEGESL